VAIGKNVLDGITTLTFRMKKELCDRFRIQEDHVGVWTSGVSTSLFDPNKYDGDSLRKSLSLTNKFVVFYHGAITMNRGILETIEALGLIKDEFPSMVFFIVGGGGRGLGARAHSVLKNLAQQYEVLNRVKLHSPIPYERVPEFIAMSDVCIVPLPDLPQWRNQCPLKLLEYLAMNKPVIATNIPANQEILGTNRCGIYVKTANPGEIAKAMAYAYENRKMLKEWGACGRAIVEEKYSWTKVAEDFEAYLSSLRNYSRAT
jgi:glycosyltransferase involved in cell wall biosynthesis